MPLYLQQFTGTVLSQGFGEGPYSLQTMSPDMEGTKFPRDFTSPQCDSDLLPRSPSQISSHEGCIHSLELLALKGHKVAREKLQFTLTQASHLGPLI